MPTYVYKFIDSGETIEVQQAFTDAALTEYPHPTDGELRPVKKVFQPVGVTFKGGGFYKTDSRGGSASGTSATSTTTSADASKSTSTSDSSQSSGTTASTTTSSANGSSST